jgi:hypothetical protein
MSEPVFLIALALVAATAVSVARAIAGAIGGRRAAQSELPQIREQLAQHAAALDDAQERLDFAERLLAQGRERSALGRGEERG